MSGTVNHVLLIGNIVNDPETRRFASGNSVTHFRLATSKSWKDKTTGERKEKTEFHSISIFNEHIAKVVTDYCKKGAKIYLVGALQTRKWSDQSGADRYTTEVVLQKFRGELQLLDAHGGKSSAGADRRPAAVGDGIR